MDESGSERSERSLPELVKDLSQEANTLIRKEVELAKAEVTQKVDQVKAAAQEAGPMMGRNLAKAKEEVAPKGKKMAVGVAQLVVAAVFGLVALGVLATAAIVGLTLVLPLWAATLIEAAVFLLLTISLGLGGAGAIRSAMPPVPQKTLESLKADIEQLKRRFAEAMPPKPEQTIETVKEDVEWAKTRMQSGRR